MISDSTPPRWAEFVLRALLAPHDRQTVSGDLLEEYREAICPKRGRLSADIWYVGQVAGFAWRANWAWAALLGGVLVVRFALDARVPTTDFYARAVVSTWLVVSVFFSAGFLAVRRTRLIATGAVSGVVIAILAAIIGMAGSAFLLAMWHDTATLVAIDASGGLGEVFTLPIVLALPGAMLGTLGGLCGRIAHRRPPVPYVT